MKSPEDINILIGCETIRTIIRERKQDPNDEAEQEAVIDMYKSALGMA